MITRYDLSKIADRPKGTVVTLPPIYERIGTVKAYERALRALLGGLAAEVRDGIIPLYAADVARRKTSDRLVVDVEEWWFGRLKELADTLTATATRVVERILRLEADRHSDEFMDAAKRALGVDLKAVIAKEDLAEYFETMALRNAGLIKGLSDDTVKRIQQVVVESHLEGRSVRDLRSRLKREFGLSDKRATLIAQDQTAKLNSDLNRKRQEQAGVMSYEWRTSRDERVRDRHRRLDGKVYKWGEPTGAEGGLPPGKPIRCRCVALGIVDFGDGPVRKPSRHEYPGKAVGTHGSRPARATTTVSFEKVSVIKHSALPNDPPGLVAAASVVQVHGPSEQWGDSLARYKGNAYRKINAYLRGGSPSDEVKQMVADIDAALDGATLTRDVVLYRGFSGDAVSDLAQSEIESVVQMPGYSSTTTSRHIAVGFSGTTDKHRDSGLIRILAKKGTHALDLDRFHAGGGNKGHIENEVLLPRGARFRIVNVADATVEHDDGLVAPIKVIDVEFIK